MTLGSFPYTPLHYKAAQAYLDKKAAQGLELQTIYLGYIARFKKAETPHHFVDLDLDKKRYDDPDQSWKDYFQLCADGGWQYVQTVRGMLLFRAAPGKDPIPIQTDESIEFDRFWKRYHPRLWKVLLPAALLALALLFMMRYTASFFCTSDLLTTNLGLGCLLYFLVTLLLLPIVWIFSRRYLSQCQASGRIRSPGKALTAMDGLTLLHRSLGLLVVLGIFLTLIFLPTYRHSLDPYLSYNLNPKAEMNDPAILDELPNYPVLTTHGTGLHDSAILTEDILGNRSLLVDHLRQSEEFFVGDQRYYLATERYQCVTPTVARLLLSLRLRDARNSDSPIWSTDWEPISLPDFDECYISYANGYSKSGYLLFRQGNIVAMAGCFDGLTPLDMTTPEALAFIRSCILPDA